MDKIVCEDIQWILNAVKTECFNGKEVLVAGGAGFIGSYLCDVLVKAGANVTCLDDFSTGLLWNIDHLLRNRKFKLVRGKTQRLSANGRYDFILHFASRASPEEYQLHPIETLLANSLGSQRVLELARKCNSRILFASSSEVYGDAEVIPTPETYWGHVNPVGVRSCYDEGKRYGEALFMAYYFQHGIDTRIVRIHNTYGPRLRADGVYGRALSRFIIQALEGRNITVYGDGSQTRSFCYISDMVTGILSVLADKKCSGKIFNLGNPCEILILNLARRIKELVGSSSPITFHPLPPDDPKRRCPDISKAKKLLGWEPKVSLEDGLKRTITWFRNNFRQDRQVKR